MEMLKQTNDSPIPFYKQVVFLYMGINGHFEKVPLEDVTKLEKKVYQKLDSTYSFLAQEIKDKKEMTSDIENNMRSLISEVLKENGYN
jgi:F-type H+-transporting ATPase subunit alpha